MHWNTNVIYALLLSIATADTVCDQDEIGIGTYITVDQYKDIVEHGTIYNHLCQVIGSSSSATFWEGGWNHDNIKVETKRQAQDSIVPTEGQVPTGKFHDCYPVISSACDVAVDDQDIEVNIRFCCSLVPTAFFPD